MNTYQDEGIILQVKDWQTSDKLVCAYFKEHGKVMFIAYGVKHLKNKNAALLQSFNNVSLQLSCGKKFDTLRQSELIERLVYSPDIEKLAYGGFICELTSELTPDRQGCEEVYFLLKDALSALNVRNLRLVCLAFSLKLLHINGTYPELSRCVCCQGELGENIAISPLQGGCVCSNCQTGGESGFSHQAIDLSNKLFNLDFSSTESFNVKGRELLLLEGFLHKFILTQTDKQLKSLQFLAQL